MHSNLVLLLLVPGLITAGCAGPNPAATEPAGWTVSDDSASFTDPESGDWVRFECAVDGGGRPFVHLIRSATPEIGPHLVQDMTITGSKGEAWVRISARETGDGSLQWSGPVLGSDVRKVFEQVGGSVAITLETGGTLEVPAEPAVAHAMANCVE